MNKIEIKHNLKSREETGKIIPQIIYFMCVKNKSKFQAASSSQTLIRTAARDPLLSSALQGHLNTHEPPHRDK